MLDAAPGPECDVALLIFYPAFSQISSKRKDENAGFLQNLGETWCGGSGQRQHRGLPENGSPACSCLLFLACSTNSRKSAGITLGSEILLLSVVCGACLCFKKFFHSSFQCGAPLDVALQLHCSVIFCLLFFLLFLSVLVCLVLHSSRNKTPFVAVNPACQILGITVALHE